MADHEYFTVQHHGTTIRDTYRPLRAADLRELARQAIAAAEKMERARSEWLREAIEESETFLQQKKTELAELEALGQ